MSQPIRIDASGHVVQTDRLVHVRKSINEDVRWIAQGGGGPWTIVFDKNSLGSPFSETTYPVGRGASGGSTGGPVNGTVGITYSYNVKDANGGTTDDPDVDIDA